VEDSQSQVSAVWSDIPLQVDAHGTVGESSQAQTPSKGVLVTSSLLLIAAATTAASGILAVDVPLFTVLWLTSAFQMSLMLLYSAYRPEERVFPPALARFLGSNPSIVGFAFGGLAGLWAFLVIVAPLLQPDVRLFRVVVATAATMPVALLVMRHSCAETGRNGVIVHLSLVAGSIAFLSILRIATVGFDLWLPAQ
jgi:hypothetical protein